mmetsp:Transcript_39236/g.155650  ORF Transcript_39236/g.155650 Transcript_39236/m.155650 type:complete len:261 (+) Transcript_39236:1870-2652(+)
MTFGTGWYVSDDQQRPEEQFTISVNGCASIPSLLASDIASETAVIEIPSIRLLQTLATCPLPTSPQEIALFPMHMNNDSSGLKVSSEHPAMKVKVRLTAPGTPPETGASMKSALEFLVARAAESSFAVAGSIVEESIKTDLDLASTKSPLSGSRQTSLTSLGPGSMLITILQFAATSLGVSAVTAPLKTFVNSLARNGSRSYTTILCPNFAKLAAIGAPEVVEKWFRFSFPAKNAKESTSPETRIRNSPYPCYQDRRIRR